jgi:hypothetical protein
MTRKLAVHHADSGSYETACGLRIYWPPSKPPKPTTEYAQEVTCDNCLRAHDWDRTPRCSDCGEAERTGHMGCQYPQDR